MTGVHLAAIATLSASITLGPTSDVTYLDTFTDVSMTAPARLAPDGGGGVWVTDPINKQVLLFDVGGAVTDTLTVPEGVIGVALHTDGRLFVARDDGAVGVCTAGLALQCAPGDLNAGDPCTVDTDCDLAVLDDEGGTCTNLLGVLDAAPIALAAPNDMLYDDGADELYVVDALAHRVLVFEESAPDTWTLNRYWGIEGSGMGMLTSPQAIAFEAGVAGGCETDTCVAGNIGAPCSVDADCTILDHVVVTDTDNFRGQVYDSVGTLLFKFGYRILFTAGDETAWFARSEGAAIDECGNIYLADALMGTVRVFDSEGSELDAGNLPAIGFGTGAGELRNPTDLAIDGTTLYVANTSNASVELFEVACTNGSVVASMGPGHGRDFVPPSQRKRDHRVIFPDNPAEVMTAIESGVYVGRYDLNRDRSLDFGDLDVAIEHFGMGTMHDFADGGVASHPAYAPPHIIDIPNRCGRCHSMDDQPGGDLTMAAGQENLCISCHSPGKIAHDMPIDPGDAMMNHPWGVAAADADPGPESDDPVSDHLDAGDVRCGTCHQPHELDPNFGYVRNNGSADHVPDGSPFSIKLCGSCHKEWDEWQEAGHADEHADPFSHYDWSLPNRSSCRQCHSGNGFIGFSEGLPAAERDGSFRVIDCLVCHATHGKSQDGELLRIFDEVTLPTEGPDETLSGVGTMATCMACHNGRRAPDDGSLTPHYMLGAVMLEGLNGNDFGHTLTNSQHTTDGVTCADCHMAATPAPGNPGAGKVGGHTFKLKVRKPDGFCSGGIDDGLPCAADEECDDAVEDDGLGTCTPTDADHGFENVVNACNGCHNDHDSLNRPAGADYDGNGSAEGVQDETRGLMNKVEAQIVAKGAVHLGSYPYWTLPKVCDAGNLNAGDPCTANSQCDLLVVDDGGGTCVAGPDDALLRAAIWNWEYVENAHDFGVKNTAYAVGLLQATYFELTGIEVPGATLRYTNVP